MEGTRQGFGAAGVDPSRDASDADGLLKEGGFLVLRFGEGDGDFGSADGDGDAGEAGAGAVVEEGCNARGKSLGAGDGFGEVALKNGFRIAERGEVGAGIPAKKK